MTYRTIDLFAGIGGFHIAFSELGAETVFASEWNPQARATYQANFESISPALFADTGDDENLTSNFAGDITKVETASIPDFDIVTGGFPCQPFSGAGKRGGFEDTRGTLFFNVASIIKDKKPKAFFLENVRGLLTHDDGKTFAVIKKAIAELGYSLHFQIVKASDHNVPQNRPRLFMVGFREDIDDSSFSFPEPVPLNLTLSKVLGGKVTNSAGVEKTIGFTLRVGGRNSGVHDRRNWDSYIVDGVPRAMTLAEAAQLQGFPADFKFPVSERQAFKQLGNSVAVPAIKATAKEVVRILDLNK